jgi:hypothetical protein
MCPKTLIHDSGTSPVTALLLFLLYCACPYTENGLSLNHLESYETNESCSEYCLSVSGDTLKARKDIVVSQNASAGKEKKK